MLDVLTRAIVTLSLCAASLTAQAATVTTNEGYLFPSLL